MANVYFCEKFAFEFKVNIDNIQFQKYFEY